MHWIALCAPPDAPTSQADQNGSVQPANPLVAAAWWALRFTPLVARVGEVLVLEVSGSERLFGGQAALLTQFFEKNSPVAPMECAQGATSLIAIGRLLHGVRQRPERQAHTAAVPADALPVAVLAAAQPHLPTLARLGVRTWAQLRALPRGGVARRFGAALVDALDRAYGHQAEVYPWLTLPDVFDMPLELTASVDNAPALLFGARRLLAQLQVWLRARQRGVLALELVWELDARRANTRHVDAHHQGGQQGQLVLRTGEATQDVVHLQRLLGEQLQRDTLPSPVLYLRMRTLQTQPLAGETHSLLPEDLRKGDSLHQTLERIAARLGAHQVLCATPHADHRPERMQRWHAWQATPEDKSATKKGAARAYSMGANGQNGSKPAEAQPGTIHPHAATYPTWLLPTPQPLQLHHDAPQYHGPLELLSGPQRLETGWLEGEPALRDYFIARSPHAGLVWVYRDRLATGLAGAWYLHGIFG